MDMRTISITDTTPQPTATTTTLPRHTSQIHSQLEATTPMDIIRIERRHGHMKQHMDSTNHIMMKMIIMITKYVIFMMGPTRMLIFTQSSPE